MGMDGLGIDCGCCGSTSCATLCCYVLGCNSQSLTGLTVELRRAVVSTVAVTNGGSGYTSAPAVSFSGGGNPGGTGSAATATATLSGGMVASVTVTGGGSGWASTPTVSFSGGGGTGATATATLATNVLGSGTTTGQVFSIAVNNHGSGYTSPPAVAISGGGGTGATATATLSGGTVASVAVTADGSGYTSVPTVSFSGGGGTGATATATLNNQYCFGVPASGNYFFAATSVPARYTTSGAVSSQTHVSCPSSTATFAFVTLAPAAGYSCHCSHCADPVSDTLTLTDSNTTLTLTWHPSPGNWQGCYTISAQPVNGNNLSCVCTGSAGTGTIAVAYIVGCPPSSPGSYTLGQQWSGCVGNPAPTAVAGTCAGDVVSGAGCTQLMTPTVVASGTQAPNNCASGPLSFSVTNGLVNGTVAVSGF